MKPIPQSFLLSLLWLLLLNPRASAQRLPHIATPERYTLGFVLDFTHETFEGEETIQVRVLQPVDHIVLNAVAIDFHRASIVSGAITQAAHVSLDEENETATLAVDRTLAPGPATIAIRYTGILSHDLRGFYLGNDEQKRKYAVTQFEATDARRAFPSFDEPAYKAIFDVTVAAPKNMTVISNSSMIVDSDGPGEDSHTVRFASTLKMSTYLLAIAAGEFEFIEGAAEGIPIRVYTTRGKKRLGDFALEAAENILPYYNQYFGTKYPYNKLDLLGLPDFSAGAMENTACITFRESLLLLDENRSSLAQKKQVASTVAHEIAHQWFGDLVTMHWWNDVWLNEGLATWMSSKPLEAWKPQWQIPLDDVHDMVHAFDVDSLANTRPIRLAAETPAQILELFDVGIEYDKTAAVLRMVESYVGPDDFRAGVNRYLKAHAYANATAEDFWNALALASRKPVDQVMSTFVAQPGVPLVSVRNECTGTTGKLIIAQQRSFFDRERLDTSGDQLWTIPVCVKSESGGQSIKHCELLTKKEEEVALPQCATWLFANADARGYYRSLYEPESALALSRAALSKLNSAERILLLQDEWFSVRAGRASIADYLELVSHLREEQNPAVMREIVSTLTYIGTHLLDAGDRGAYALWVRQLLSPLAKQLGFHPQPGETAAHKALRNYVLQALGGLGHDPEVLAEAQSFTGRMLERTGTYDPEEAKIMVPLAAQSGNAALYDKILVQVKGARTPEDFELWLKALAQFSDPALLKRTLALAISPPVRSQDTPRVIAWVMQNPAGRSAALDFIRSNWSQVDANGGAFLADQLTAAISSFCDPRLQAEVQEIFPDGGGALEERSLQQAFEQIGYCVALKSHQENALRTWLQANATSSSAPASPGTEHGTAH